MSGGEVLGRDGGEEASGQIVEAGGSEGVRVGGGAGAGGDDGGGIGWDMIPRDSYRNWLPCKSCYEPVCRNWDKVMSRSPCPLRPCLRVRECVCEGVIMCMCLRACLCGHTPILCVPSRRRFCVPGVSSLQRLPDLCQIPQVPELQASVESIAARHGRERASRVGARP